MKLNSAHIISLLCLTGGVVNTAPVMAANWSPTNASCQQLAQKALPDSKITQAERVPAGKV